MTKRPLSYTILAFCGIAAASHALALGFGRIPDSVVFGQPLDLSVPLRLDPGESLTPACLQAEVSIGEQRLPTSAVSVTLERTADGLDGARLRIRSNVVVQEPLVSVNLAAGCNGSVSRQFVLFADPPSTVVALAPAPAPALVASAPVAAESSSPRAETQTAQAVAPPALKATATASSKATRSKSGTSAARTNASPGVSTGVGTGANPSASPEAARKRVQAQAAAAPAKARSADRAVSRAPERAVPRLKLEEPDERLQAAMLTVAAQDAAAASAAMAASAAQAAASASEQRLASLEKSLQDMRAEAAAHRATVEQMRQRVAQAEEQNRWMWALSLAVLLLGGFAVWLGLRVRALQRERQTGWWVAAQAGVASDDAAQATNAVTTPAVAVGVELSAARGEPAFALASEAAFARPLIPPQASPAEVLAPVPVSAAPLLQPVLTQASNEPSPVYRSGALVGAPTAQESLTRAVSVDELIDLEQQAEFFIVLGEEDAAIDLLMSHLRSTGGVSPLPYLKLLEIYRRRQDSEAHERMRKRFNHRFNAVAPDWQADPDDGRDLQDYPAVLATVQAAWPTPLDAMAELENLLFRKRSNELFELPAYRDVLALFAVARDLHRTGDEEPEDVDVLLPLLSQHDLGSTVPLSIFDRLDRSDDLGAAVVEDRPTAPVDLDLSESSAVGASLQRVY